MTTNSDFVAEATRATPAVTVTGLTLAGIPLSDVVLILTVVLLAGQIFFLFRDKWYKPRKARKVNNGRN